MENRIKELLEASRFLIYDESWWEGGKDSESVISYDDVLGIIEEDEKSIISKVEEVMKSFGIDEGLVKKVINKLNNEK